MTFACHPTTYAGDWAFDSTGCESGAGNEAAWVILRQFCHRPAGGPESGAEGPMANALDLC